MTKNEYHIRQIELLQQRCEDLEYLFLRYAEFSGHKTCGEVADALGHFHNQDEEIAPSRSSAIAAIVGGVTTDDFPDCCAVGTTRGFDCSGTLIAPNLVLTAKHCTGATRVLLNTSNVSVGGDLHVVASKKAHANLDAQLLILEDRSSVPPRQIATGHETQVPRGTIVGFGATDTRGTTGMGIKRKAEVDVISSQCTGPGESGQFGCKPGDELVSGHGSVARDTCKGDSGGPIYASLASGGFALLGVTSRRSLNSSNVCGDHTIYVRADVLLPWISQITGVDL